MKKYYIILFFLIINCSVSFSQEEIDSVIFPYPHYLYQWVDDSAAMCFHDGHVCCHGYLQLSQYMGSAVGYGAAFNNYPAIDRSHTKVFAAKYEVQDSVKIIGLAVIMYRNRSCATIHYDFDTCNEITGDTICTALNLYKPGADPSNMQLLRSDTIRGNHPARRIGLEGIHRWYIGCDDERIAESVFTAHFNSYEVYFDEPVTLTDSFYVGWVLLCDLDSINWAVGGHAPAHFYEVHPTSDFPCRFPVNYFKYYIEDIYTNPGWHFTFAQQVVYIMPIVERECDTCGMVRDIGQQWLAENTLFVQWDTLPNHTSWQLSYGPSGTAPGDGTIVDCTIPQAVIGGISQDDEVVFYVRGRCKDIPWRQWSPWSVVQQAGVSAIVAPDGGRPALAVSPNPTKGLLHVECSDPITAVELYSFRGDLLLSRPAHSGSTLDLDISTLPQAPYILVAHTDKGTTSCVVAKQ